MDDLKTQYNKIKVVDPKLKDVSFGDWKIKLGAEAWAKARFENKRTKKKTGGTVFVNKPMNIGRRSKIK